jgi:hypothetical protein
MRRNPKSHVPVVAAAGDVSVVVEGAEAATVAVEAASSLAVSTDSAGTPLARGVPVASHQGRTNEKSDLSDSAHDSIL